MWHSIVLDRLIVAWDRTTVLSVCNITDHLQQFLGISRRNMHQRLAINLWLASIELL